MNRLVSVIALAGALVFSAAIGLSTTSDAVAKSDKLSAEDFRAEMRRLWEDHIVWTRQYIVSAATLDTDLPDIVPTAERLFRNQADIGAAIAPFYGDAAADALTTLLNDHIAVAAEAVAVAKEGNSTGLDDALERWYANADAIATFLAEANPTNWPFEAMSRHMRDHLDLTLAEATARLTGDHAADIAAYDQIHEQILHMADMLADGIVAQFPSRFNR